MNFSTASNYELDILNIIWDKEGPITATEIIEKDTKYDHLAVLTYLSRLCKKGLVEKKRDEEDKRSNIYKALVSREEYSIMITKFVYEKVCNRSESCFAISIYKSNILSKESLNYFEQLLEHS